MTNYRFVVAAVSIPTITAIFGLLWFWDRKKKKELIPNDSSSVSEALNKNSNSFSGSYSSLYEALSEPLNNGTTNNIAVISGKDDKSYNDDEHTNQRPLLGQDWVQKVNSSFLSNDSEESINSEPSIDASSKNCVSVADQEFSEESPSVDSEINKLIASFSSLNCQTPKTELLESQSENKILSSCSTKPFIEDLLEDKNKEGKIECYDWEAEIVQNKEKEEKDLIPEVKNELPTSKDSKTLVETFDKNVEEQAKDNSVALHENISDALGHEENDHRASSLETFEENVESVKAVSSELISEEESDDQSELSGTKSNGFETEEADPLLGASDEEVYEDVKDLIPQVKNGHYQELLVSEDISECEKTIPAQDSLKDEDEQSEDFTPELENGMCSEVLTSDGYVSESENTNPFTDECDFDQMQDESNLDDIKLSSKQIDVISAMFSGGQLDDSQLKEDLAHLEAQATKMSTPNHAASEKLLSRAKQLFHETRSITPPDTDSDTFLSSKELMSETTESSQTDSSLIPDQSNQSDDDDDDEKDNSSFLSSSPHKELENQLDYLSKKFFGNGQIPTDNKTSSDRLDGQHPAEDLAKPEASNSEPSHEKALSQKLDKSSNSDLPISTDTLEQQHCTEVSSENKSLLLHVGTVVEHSTENTVTEKNSEKELEKTNKDVLSQELEKGLESELNRTLKNSNKTLVASEPSQEATNTVDGTLCLAHDSMHNTSSEEQSRHPLESNTVTKAESDLEKMSPPKEQGKPDSVLSSNCDAKNTNFSEVNKNVAVKTKSSTLYEFYFPSELCGRLIGRQGKNIFHIKERSGASVSLQPSPYTPNHQICSIEGTQEEIDEALKCISHKFPSSIYPNVDLTAITDSTQLASSPVVVPDLIQLSLPPEGVSIDVLVASLVDGSHLFLQLPTHPTYAALERLNQFMNRCYSQPGMVPQLPRPLAVGVICAAPVMEGWYRAVIVAVSEETDECEIRFVDYGGFSRVPGNLLRQIRSDFMTLPFQAIEAYLANITPLQNENYFSERAVEILQELTESGMLQAQVVSRAEDGTPYVHIYQINGNKVTFVNRELVNRGVVRWIEVL